MKERFILNPLSSFLLKCGLFVCTLAYIGIFIRSYIISQTETLKAYEISLMLQYVTMAVTILVIFTLVFDIHIKRTK